MDPKRILHSLTKVCLINRQPCLGKPEITSKKGTKFQQSKKISIIATIKKNQNVMVLHNKLLYYMINQEVFAINQFLKNNQIMGQGHKYLYNITMIHIRILGIYRISSKAKEENGFRKHIQIKWFWCLRIH